MPEGLDVARPCCARPTASPPRSAARGEPPVSWDDRADLVATRLAALPAAHGPESVAVFGGGGLTNEKAYALGKFARTVLRHAEHRLQRPVLHGERGRRRQPDARARPRPAVPAGRPRRRAGRPAARLQPRRDDAAGRASTSPGVRARGGLIVVDPRRSATAELTADGGGLHVQPRARAPTSRCCSALAHIVLAEGFADHGVPRRADDRARRRPPVARRLVAGADRAGHRRARRDAARRPRSCWPTPRRRAAAPARTSSPAAGVEQSTPGHRHRHRGDHARAPARPARPRRLRVRRDHRPGQRAGRPRARAEGRPAARLPSIEDEAARAHVAGVWGVDPADLPGPGCPPSSCCARSARPGGPRALLVHGSNVLVSAPDADRVRERLASLDLLVVCDFVPSETALLADVVLPVTQWAEEEGTMTSLEGRVIRRRRPCRRRPGCAASSRSSPTSPRGSASTVPFDDRPGRGLRRAGPRVARAAAPTTAGSATRAWTPSDGPVLARPRRPTPHPGTRGCSSTASRRPTAAPA